MHPNITGDYAARIKDYQNAAAYYAQRARLERDEIAEYFVQHPERFRGEYYRRLMADFILLSERAAYYALEARRMMWVR